MLLQLLDYASLVRRLVEAAYLWRSLPGQRTLHFVLHRSCYGPGKRYSRCDATGLWYGRISVAHELTLMLACWRLNMGHRRLCIPKFSFSFRLFCWMWLVWTSHM